MDKDKMGRMDYEDISGYGMQTSIVFGELLHYGKWYQVSFK